MVSQCVENNRLLWGWKMIRTGKSWIRMCGHQMFSETSSVVENLPNQSGTRGFMTPTLILSLALASSIHNKQLRRLTKCAWQERWCFWSHTLPVPTLLVLACTPRLTIKLDRLIVLSKSSLLGWFLHVSLIVIIKGRSPMEVSLIVIIAEQVATCSPLDQ